MNYISRNIGILPDFHNNMRSKVQCAASSPGLKLAGQERKSNPAEADPDDPAPTGAEAPEARKIGRTRDSINSKVHEPADALRRLLRFHRLAEERLRGRGNSAEKSARSENACRRPRL